MRNGHGAPGKALAEPTRSCSACIGPGDALAAQFHGSGNSGSARSRAAICSSSARLLRLGASPAYFWRTAAWAAGELGVSNCANARAGGSSISFSYGAAM